MYLMLTDYHAQMARLPAKERIDFLWELRFQLLNMTVEFNLEASTPEQATDMPEGVIIAQPIYIQDMTRDLFFRRVFGVRKGVLAVQWKLERKFGAPPSLGVAFNVKSPVS